MGLSGACSLFFFSCAIYSSCTFCWIVSPVIIHHLNLLFAIKILVSSLSKANALIILDPSSIDFMIQMANMPVQWTL